MFCTVVSWSARDLTSFRRLPCTDEVQPIRLQLGITQINQKPEKILQPDTTRKQSKAHKLYHYIKIVLHPYCSAWPRLKLNTKIGLHNTHHPSTTQTLRQQYLNCYWPELDQTLNWVLGTYTTEYN